MAAAGPIFPYTLTKLEPSLAARRSMAIGRTPIDLPPARADGSRSVPKHDHQAQKSPHNSVNREMNIQRQRDTLPLALAAADAGARCCDIVDQDGIFSMCALIERCNVY
jgi:hypothetical protein